MTHQTTEFIVSENKIATYPYILMALSQNSTLAKLSDYITAGRSAYEMFQFLHSDKLIRTILTALYTDHKERQILAQRSFLHATGIYKLPLTKSSYDQPEARLHIWRSGNLFPQGSKYESVHNHRWNFYSKILLGQFHKVLYRAQQNSSGKFHHYKFIATAPGQMNNIEEYGYADLTKTFDTELLPNQKYYLDGKVHHIIEPINERLSCTLIVREPYTRDETDVFLPKERSFVKQSRHSLIDIDSQLIKKLIQELLNECN